MRPEKTSIVAEIERQAAASSFVLLADYQGLKVDQVDRLRSRLRAGGADLHVVKNRLFKRVATDHGWSSLVPHLRGPTAVVTGRDVTAAAKTLRQFMADNNSRPALKGGVLGAAALSNADIDALAKLPGREALYGMLVGTLAAPMTRLTGVMRQKLMSLLFVLKAVEKKKSA